MTTVIGMPKTCAENWDALLEYLFPGEYDVVEIDYTSLPKVDIVVFDGGPDVSPSMYEEEKHPTTYVNESRDNFESVVFNHYRSLGTRMFGICRGNQFINVMLGGKLHQDIPSMGLGHNANHVIVRQPLAMLPIPKRVVVNSTHHQAVSVPGKGLHVTAKHENGIIEGTEDMDNTIRTVQFHPEYLSYKDIDIPVLKYLLFRDVIGSDHTD